MVFLGTSGLLAYNSAAEAMHDAARVMFRDSGAKVKRAMWLQRLPPSPTRATAGSYFQ